MIQSGQPMSCQIARDAPGLPAALEEYVARIYAGILGPLAFLTTLAEGVLHARPAEVTLWTAWANLWVFAALGCIAGWIARRSVDEAVRQRFSQELTNQPDHHATA